MAFVQVKTYEAGGGATTHNVTFDGAVTAGNTLVVALMVTDGAGAGIASRVTSIVVTDNVDGGNWPQVGTTISPDADDQNLACMFYRSGATGGSTTLTVTTNVSTTVFAVASEEGGTLTLEDFATNNVGDNVTAHTTGTVTTTGTSRRLVSMIVSDANMTSIAPATGETERGEVAGRLQLQDEDAATPGDYTASWSLGATADVCSIIAAFGSAAALQFFQFNTQHQYHARR